MRFRGIRLPLLAAVLGASVGLSLLATDRSYGQALYVYPTSTTISLSTPYVLPTSYVVPSSYVFPSYVESAYTVEPSVSLLPTGYIATTYRRGLFGRRWVVERPVVASYYSSALCPDNLRVGLSTDDIRRSVVLCDIVQRSPVPTNDLQVLPDRVLSDRL